ncbi:IPExxxVDY family protein [Paradesertivirga mongoliensis]|uniref:IPExxxVDY family protein n=1 Tax=Paradesertivirga mongoliensis TaxID=2100740 RepID=A0ABW4ZHN8_9SPHI|nr:IPExxxVDY family protein [Pedobacter mongoliensis]
MNRLTLKYELDLDFVLIAITSQLKDYMLCFKLNRQLNINLYKIDELVIESNSNEIFFSRYQYQIPESETDVYLLANKGDQGYLIPEMKRVDYFILIRNYISEEEVEQMIDDINKLPEILAAIEVDPRKLKSKENLIF